MSGKERGKKGEEHHAICHEQDRRERTVSQSNASSTIEYFLQSSIVRALPRVRRRSSFVVAGVKVRQR